MRLTFPKRSFSCIKCGICCDNLTGLYYTKNDRRRISFPSKSVYNLLFPYYVEFKRFRCPYLDKTICSHHTNRPMLCRTFPLRFYIDEAHLYDEIKTRDHVEDALLVMMAQCPGVGTGSEVNKEYVQKVLDEIDQLQGPQFLLDLMRRYQETYRVHTHFYRDTTATADVKEAFYLRILKDAFEHKEIPYSLALQHIGNDYLKETHRLLDNHTTEVDMSFIKQLQSITTEFIPCPQGIDWKRQKMFHAEIEQHDKDILFAYGKEIIARRGSFGIIRFNATSGVMVLSKLLQNIEVRQGGTQSLIEAFDMNIGNCVETIIDDKAGPVTPQH